MAGSLSAHDVSLHGDPWLFIGGDLDVTDLVVCGGGSESILDVGGDLRVRAVVAAPWANVKVRGEVDAIVAAETGPDKTKGRRFAPRQVLLPGYVNDNDDPDLSALDAAIESGVDPLRRVDGRLVGDKSRLRHVFVSQIPPFGPPLGYGQWPMESIEEERDGPNPDPEQCRTR